MDLINIKEYVQKTTAIISTIANMQVLICNSSYTIIGDSNNKQKELRTLTDNSHLSETIRTRKMLITEDCQRNYPGCQDCPTRADCDITAMISIPIIDGNQIYGGIGIYAQKKEDVKRLMENNKDFIEFIHRMAELLIMKLKEDAQTRELKETVRKLQNNSCNMPFDQIVGSSLEIKTLKEEARRFAQSESTVLIQGESGTGKEVFARAIHTASGKSEGPFIAINCAAIPEALIESELFGYEEGAFTGAMKGGKIGKFELADKGTLFLDEIGEFPIHLQAKLLRALQERKIQRIGGNQEIDVDVRIIAATNQRLEECVKNGEFREDLYYRLSVIPLYLPALRERRNDIGDLALFFLGIYAKAMNKDIVDFDGDAMKVLQTYSWPGNIRELQNAVEYAVNMCNGQYIRLTDLPKKLLDVDEQPHENLTLKPLKYVEDEYIREAIRVYGNTLEGKTKAAKILGISKATLYRRLKEM